MFSISTFRSAGSPGPLDRKIPSGSAARTSSGRFSRIDRQPAAFFHQTFQDVPLHPVVHDGYGIFGVFRTHGVDLFGGHLGHLVMFFRRGQEGLDLVFRSIRRHHHALDGPVGADPAGQRPGIHPGEHRDVVLFQEFQYRAFIPPAGGLIAQFVHDQPFVAASVRLVKDLVAAVVADQGICEDDDLPTVRRIRKGFLIAAHAGREHDLSDGPAVTVQGAFIDAAVFQYQFAFYFLHTTPSFITNRPSTMVATAMPLQCFPLKGVTLPRV